MSHVLRLTVLGLSITLGTATTCQAEARSAQPFFEALDGNGDGSLTKAELEAHRAARLSDADSNGDGMLSEAELAARGAERAQKRAARMVERLDSDKDGLISQEELSAGMKRGPGRMFERADANSDGVVSKAEFDAMAKAMKQRRQGD